MVGNVVMDGELEVPFSDEQIETLELEGIVIFIEWQDAEAVYFVTEEWEICCAAFGIAPMEALAIFLKHPLTADTAGR
jgi:hypothetical protein